jgi:hypothetical protein
MHLKPAPHLTFLHFPTLPTLCIFPIFLQLVGSSFPILCTLTSYASPTLTPPQRLSRLICRSQPFRRTSPFFGPVALPVCSPLFTTFSPNGLSETVPFNPKSYTFLHFPTLRYAPETLSGKDFPTLSYTSYTLHRFGFCLHFL